MIKTLLLLSAGLALATSTIAGGIDLSAVSCPGEPGALGATVAVCAFPGCPPLFYGGQDVDCASGGEISLLATWAPNAAIPDLMALEGIIDCLIPGGIDGNPFWNYFDAGQGCSSDGLVTDHQRPASCASPVAYTNVWNMNGLSAAAAIRRGPDQGRIQFVCARSAPIAVAAEQRLFGVRFVFDGSMAAEAGGSCSGCCKEIDMVWSQGNAQQASGEVQILTNGTGRINGFSSAMVFRGSAASCLPVRTVTRSWGQIKTLYR